MVQGIKRALLPYLYREVRAYYLYPIQCGTKLKIAIFSILGHHDNPLG